MLLTHLTSSASCRIVRALPCSFPLHCYTFIYCLCLSASSLQGRASKEALRILKPYSRSPGSSLAAWRLGTTSFLEDNVKKVGVALLSLLEEQYVKYYSSNVKTSLYCIFWTPFMKSDRGQTRWSTKVYDVEFVIVLVNRTSSPTSNWNSHGHWSGRNSTQILNLSETTNSRLIIIWKEDFAFNG